MLNGLRQAVNCRAKLVAQNLGTIIWVVSISLFIQRTTVRWRLVAGTKSEIPGET